MSTTTVNALVFRDLTAPRDPAEGERSVVDSARELLEFVADRHLSRPPTSATYRMCEGVAVMDAVICGQVVCVVSPTPYIKATDVTHVAVNGSFVQFQPEESRPVASLGWPLWDAIVEAARIYS